MSDKILEKYNATFLLHALGDTIGFKNGDWEFNYNNKYVDYRTTLEIVFDFISLGGITSIDLKDWHISDDTLFHISIAKSLLDIDFKDNLTDKQINKIKDNMIKTLDDIEKDEHNKIFRGMGVTTYSSLKGKTIPYNYTGGNGVAMRNLCIGLAFNNKKDLNKLIDFSIKSGKITHRNPIGFLGGLTTAYFTHLAINNIKLEEWPFKIIKLVESQEVLNYIDISYSEEQINYRLFLSLWKKYIELRFKDNKPIYTNSHKNLIFRTKFFHDFKQNYDYYDRFTNENPYNSIGGSGVTAVLMAYDALLDARDNWEKLIYYSMLHVGDSDTVGAIAGGLYGALYGFKNVPDNLLAHIEKKNILYEISEKIFNKFNK